tara:strand:- start:276 stop:1586 length:1311 start_codon:yes stop_codon:yes gene_type:complete
MSEKKKVLTLGDTPPIKLEKKIKVLTLGDMPLSPSGVGIQTKYTIEGLLRTGKYKFFTLGGAISHQEYNPIKTEEFEDDWIILPVDNFGSPDVIRTIIRAEKPDILWFMTDPRFYTWLWNMEDEIRPLIPMVYYHVWDNKPYPNFNKTYYDSTDVVVAISKVTHDIVSNVSPDVENYYLPHTVETDVFKKLKNAEIKKLKKEHFGPDKDKFIFFWNNRNARRKHSGTLIFWFKDFLDEVGHDKAMLLMHTEPRDPNGPNLEVILHDLGLVNGEVKFSQKKVPPEELAKMYNMVDCTVNIADAEGFGLGTLESLSCETPIIVTMTGGMQEQVTDGKNWFGVGLEPASKMLVGSQDVPFIYEDRISREDFIEALKKIYFMPKKELAKVGAAGRAHVIKEYNFESFGEKWDKVLSSVYEKYGSWETREHYNSWAFKEVA